MKILIIFVYISVVIGISIAGWMYIPKWDDFYFMNGYGWFHDLVASGNFRLPFILNGVSYKLAVYLMAFLLPICLIIFFILLFFLSFARLPNIKSVKDVSYLFIISGYILSSWFIVRDFIFYYEASIIYCIFQIFVMLYLIPYRILLSGNILKLDKFSSWGILLITPLIAIINESNICIVPILLLAIIFDKFCYKHKVNIFLMYSGVIYFIVSLTHIVWGRFSRGHEYLTTDIRSNAILVIHKFIQLNFNVLIVLLVLFICLVFVIRKNNNSLSNSICTVLVYLSVIIVNILSIIPISIDRLFTRVFILGAVFLLIISLILLDIILSLIESKIIVNISYVITLIVFATVSMYYVFLIDKSSMDIYLNFSIMQDKILLLKTQGIKAICVTGFDNYYVGNNYIYGNEWYASDVAKFFGVKKLIISDICK